jgi:mono/diheme cytochrome c family protein
MIKTIGITLTACALFVCFGFVMRNLHKTDAAVVFAYSTENAEQNYQTYCGNCHGEKMIAFTDRSWKNGKTRADLYKSIKTGHADQPLNRIL